MLLGKFAAALAAAFLFLAAPALAQADDPENTLLLQLKDGTVTIKLRPDLAPNHVERLKTLTRQGFYDGVVFHRVIDGFMAQTGDPTGTGSGGSDLPDLKAEFTDTPFARGVIGMARTQRSGQRQLAVLHHVRRSAVAERPVHGARRGGERHGSRRRDQEGRRRPTTAWSTDPTRSSA